MDLMMRRRALMGMGGKKEEYALTKKDQPVILAAFYNAGLCASPDYMTVAEAAVITNEQFNAVDFTDAAEDFSGFRYFTGVTALSYTRFARYNFTKIIIPNSITTSSNYIFADCSGLVSVVLFATITDVVDGMFRFCSALKEVVVGTSITSIKNIAFQNSPIESLICKAATPPTLNSGSSLRTEAVVYVPGSSVSAYQAADNWSNYTIKGISEYQGNLIDYVL